MKYFTDNEVMCNCGCRLYLPNPILFKMIDEARSRAKIPFVITSWTRCKEWNTKVGGSNTSSHLLGKAIDIKYNNSMDLFKIVSAIIAVGFTRIGINYKAKFVHVDIDLDKTSPVLFSY